MRYLLSVLLAGCVCVFSGCAATVPAELAKAREAYQRAVSGPASQEAPAELHVAHQALEKAEAAFREDDDSYDTIDLSYIAERRAQMAESIARLNVEKKVAAQADAEYQQLQVRITETARAEALAAEQARAKTAEQLTQAEEQAKAEAARRDAEAAAAAAQMEAEQQARSEAEKRAAEAEAELAKIVALREEERGLVMTLSGSVLFRTNEAALLPEAQARLDQVADALLKSYRERKLIIIGHTDSQGPDPYNMNLSQNRAAAVRNHLIRRGLPGENLQAMGMGESEPVADNASPEGRANNRRVEIVIQPTPVP